MKVQRNDQAGPAAPKSEPVIPPVSDVPASSRSSSKITYKALDHTASDREAWFYPNCGRPHEFFIDYCGCGYNKKESPIRPMAAEVVKEAPEKTDSTGSGNP